MEKLSVSDWAVRVFVGAMALGTFALMVLGFYWNDWRASLGIVLFTTSILCNVCVYLLADAPQASATIHALPSSNRQSRADANAANA